MTKLGIVGLLNDEACHDVHSPTLQPGFAWVCCRASDTEALSLLLRR